MQKLQPAATDRLETGPTRSAFVEEDAPGTVPATGSLTRQGEITAWQPERVDEAIVAFHQRHSAVCEQYRGLRARLLAANPTRAAQVIAITSAVPEEGKSVSAANLALVMAEGEQRVLLVDADLRRGRLAGMLGIPSTPGLADVLRRQVQLSAAIQPTPLANLRVLSAGGGLPFKGASPRDVNVAARIGDWAALLAELRRGYDYTFLDMPPVTTVSDVSLLAPQCDGAIIVVLMRRTPEPTVQQAVRTLQANQIKVLGAILSRFEERGPEYYDYYDGSGHRD